MLWRFEIWKDEPLKTTVSGSPYFEPAPWGPHAPQIKTDCISGTGVDSRIRGTNKKFLGGEQFVTLLLDRTLNPFGLFYFFPLVVEFYVLGLEQITWSKSCLKLNFK